MGIEKKFCFIGAFGTTAKWTYWSVWCCRRSHWDIRRGIDWTWWNICCEHRFFSFNLKYLPWKAHITTLTPAGWIPETQLFFTVLKATTIPTEQKWNWNLNSLIILYPNYVLCINLSPYPNSFLSQKMEE